MRYDENQHVADINRWIAEAQVGAAALESSIMAQAPNGSVQNCQSQAVKEMEDFLRAGIAPVIEQSRVRWDTAPSPDEIPEHAIPPGSYYD